MKILLATDGSEHAESAAALLAHLPHAEPLELTILAVTSLMEFHGSIEVVDWMKRNAAAEKAKAAEDCQRIARYVEGADAKIETLIVEGHAGATIVATADARDIDLIVIGAVGLNVIERLMLGSVSDFVATHASCSVLVVRPTELDEHRELSICIADDESPPAKFAIEQLGHFGWGRNVKFDLVNVILSPLTYSDIPITWDTDELRAEKLKILETRLDDLKKLSPNVKTHVIAASHVGDALVGFAKEQANDMIVLGSTGRGLLARFLMGSVSRFVLRHARCSVWVARKPAT